MTSAMGLRAESKVCARSGVSVLGGSSSVQSSGLSDVLASVSGAGISLAEVRTAVPLDEEHRRQLAEALSANLGKQVEVKVIVDPTVLGGVVARIGDTVIDGTVRHRLEQLREAL